MSKYFNILAKQSGIHFCEQVLSAAASINYNSYKLLSMALKQLHSQIPASGDGCVPSILSKTGVHQTASKCILNSSTKSIFTF